MRKSRKPKIRSRFVRYRVTEEEFAELTALAEREGFLTISEFARARTLCAKLAAIVTASEPVAKASPGERLIAEQIRRVGINLNQIAHMQNMLRIPAPAELAPLLMEISRYLQLVWAREGF